MHEVLEEVKLTYAERNQNAGSFLGGCDWEGTQWNSLG